MGAAGDPARGHRARRDQPPAGRRQPGRADRPAPDARVLRERGEDEQRRKIVIPDTAHGTNPASVTMAGYEVTPVQDRRARQHRPRRPPRQGRRAHRRADADEPLDARALRREHRGDPRRLPRRRRAHVLRRREPERRLRDLAARATWASTSSTSTCTRRSRSRTAAVGRAAGRSPSATSLEPFLPVPVVVRDGRRASASTTTGRGRSARCAASRGRSASSSARTRSCARGARACAR